MPKDLRTYLKDVGDRLLTIKKEVDPLTNMGIPCAQTKTPILFENVKGYKGWSVVSALLPTREFQAIALGTTPENVVPYLGKLFERTPRPCRLVKDGPVKEKKFIGKDADITKLPILIHSLEDNGRYIGAGINITKDPDTGVRNLACLRMQIRGPHKTGLSIAPRHSLLNYEKWQNMDKPMPMAVVLGHHPAIEIATNYCTSYPLDELEVAGAMMDEDVELVKCETIDMEVPAYAEIVIEGEVLPHVREPEGTFGEFQGYYGVADGIRPVFQVKAITMREDAIYRHIQANANDHHAFVGLPMEGRLYKELKDVEGYIDLKDVYLPFYGGMFLVIVQLTPLFEGQVTDVMMAALSSSYLHPKVVIVVDEDVNIYDPGDILWAVATRVDPVKDILMIPNVRNHPIDPSIFNELIPAGGGRWQKVGSKVGINATKPSTSFPDKRKKFRRVRPMGFGKVDLKDFI